VGNEIPTKAREVVRHRQNSQCCRCGARYAELHHRQRRREGGHGYENLVGLCSTCHKWAHANPKRAVEDGYIIPIHIDDIAAVPIKTFMGWLRFEEDGGTVFTDN
jgi:hypothetical protein